MNQEEILKKEIEFAAYGKQVLNNPAFKEVMTVRKAQLFEVFCRTKQDQPEIREEAWRTMQNITALENYLTTALTTGKMATSTLESLTETKE